MTHTLTLYSSTNTIRATLVIEDGCRVEIDGIVLWSSDGSPTRYETGTIVRLVDDNEAFALDQPIEILRWSADDIADIKQRGAELWKEMHLVVEADETDAPEPEIETCCFGDAMRAMREKRHVQAQFDGEWLDARAGAAFVEAFQAGEWRSFDVRKATAWRIVEQPSEPAFTPPPGEFSGCRCPTCPEKRTPKRQCSCCEDRRLSDKYPDPPEDGPKPSIGGNGAGGCEVWDESEEP